MATNRSAAVKKAWVTRKRGSRNVTDPSRRKALASMLRSRRAAGLGFPGWFRISPQNRSILAKQVAARKRVAATMVKAQSARPQQRTPKLSSSLRGSVLVERLPRKWGWRGR